MQLAHLTAAFHRLLYTDQRSVHVGTVDWRLFIDVSTEQQGLHKG
jgi:hypothetical protein